jgi:hypothetical protein
MCGRLRGPDGGVRRELRCDFRRGNRCEGKRVVFPANSASEFASENPADRFGIAEDDELAGVFDCGKPAPPQLAQKRLAADEAFDIAHFPANDRTLLNRFAGENGAKN